VAESLERKLAAARARLALERPFIGALVMHLAFVPDARVRTVATDARSVHYNPGYIAALTFAETQFVLAHAALHCALGHFHRGRHRVRARWDRACDFCVNGLLVDDGMAAPAGVLLDAAYRGMAADEIYPLLDAATTGEPLDEHWFGGAGGEVAAAGAREDSHSPREALVETTFLEAHRDGLDEVLTRAGPAGELAVAWQDRLAAAALEAANAGRLGPMFREAIDQWIQPRLPWRTLLARFLMAASRDDYSFQRPGRREGPAILPGLQSVGVELVVALDTSGSVTRADFLAFLDELDALRGQIHGAVTLLACDAALAPGGPWRFEAWEPIRLPADLRGGGGTRFTPVFDWIGAQGLRPDAVVYFTDGQGEFPAAAPDYPVLWIVKGRAPVPWGERVQLN
jgi:predicted metal-dependent peptidase